MDFDFSPVESVDKVPEQFRPLYSQQPGEDGKFGVDPNFKGVAEALNGFNRTTKQLRLDLKNRAIDLSPLAEFGTEPASIAEAVKAAIATASASKNDDVNKAVEAAKAGITAAHAKELEKRDARANALQTQLYSLMVENAATSAIVELKGDAALLMPFVRQNVKPVEENGEYKVVVVDARGEVRYGATGSPMTIKELVAEMKADERYGRLFDSEAPPGGGFPPGQQRPGAQQRPPAQLSANEKIAQGLNRRQYSGRR